MDIRTQRALNGLVSLELTQRVAAFEAAIKALEAQIGRWSKYGHVVVPDTSFYIHHPDKVREVDFGPLINVWESPVRVLVPVVIVDELDRLKEVRDRHVRWRAGHMLGVLDEVFASGTGPSRLRAGDTAPSEPGGRLISEISIEMVFDPPGHVRLPISDDEIVDCCLAIETLAGREVTLVIYDTGQSTRARFAGLRVVKLARPQGDEPSA